MWEICIESCGPTKALLFALQKQLLSTRDDSKLASLGTIPFALVGYANIWHLIRILLVAKYLNRATQNSLSFDISIHNHIVTYVSDIFYFR